MCASNGWLLALIPDDSDDVFICRAPRGFGWGPCAPESLSLPEPVSIGSPKPIHANGIVRRKPCILTSRSESSPWKHKQWSLSPTSSSSTFPKCTHVPSLGYLSQSTQADFIVHMSMILPSKCKHYKGKSRFSLRALNSMACSGAWSSEHPVKTHRTTKVNRHVTVSKIPQVNCEPSETVTCWHHVTDFQNLVLHLTPYHTPIPECCSLCCVDPDVGLLSPGDQGIR